MSRSTLIAFLASSAVVCVGQAQQPEELTSERVQQVSATVEKVDRENRSLVLSGDGGTRVLVVVGSGVRNFEQIKAGDRVTARYREAVAVEVLPRGAEVQPPKSTTVTKRAAEGERPAAGSAQMISTTVTIESVDTSFDTVTFKRPDGIVRTVAVETPKGKELIRELRRGDQVQITYSEAVAIDVRSAG